MMMMMRHVRDQRWTVLSAVLVGVLMAPLGQGWWAAALEYYDEIRPVVVMRGEMISGDATEMRLSISGQQLRQCTYLRVQAFGRDAAGRLADAYIRRDDMDERGETKPVGAFALGVWRVWPLDGAVGAVVYVQHDCNGRLVLTKIVDISLRGSE